MAWASGSTGERPSSSAGTAATDGATEYEANRTRWELAIAAAGIGSFDYDLVTGVLVCDDRLRELFGYEDDSFPGNVEGFEQRLHPDDRQRVRGAIQDAIDACGDFEAEYRVVRPDGRMRWVQARGRTLCDEQGRPVRLLGAAYDTTAEREGQTRVARVLESMSAAFCLLDPQWRFSYVNAEAERFLGMRRKDLLGANVWELFPALRGTIFEENYRHAMTSGEPVAFEAHYPPPLDAWYEVRALPSREGLSVYFLDITARRSAQEQAQRVAQRAELLAEVTSELTGTLETEEAVARLARLLVPSLADWCIVSLLDDDAPGPPWNRLRDIGWWHSDPASRALVERYAQIRLRSLDETSFLAQSLQSRSPVVVARDTTAAVASILRTDEAQELLRRLAPARASAIPLVANGRILGLLTLCKDVDIPEQRDSDLEAALEVADRAALALDNTRLYEQQRRLAEGLQRSLLTAPPAPGHVEVAVRYVPAAEVAQVGGDWYDAFLQADGATVLVIGDVVGHDAEAAAGMGQIRGLLRGIAATTGDGPAEVLTRLDHAMALLQVETTATAVVARLERSPDDQERGVTRLRWSNAGHPPPLLINPDGTVSVLAPMSPSGVDSDLLLGLGPNAHRTESEVTLGVGSTVLLYTDGLVERRGQSLDEGLTLLRDTLSELAGCGLDELCDRVLARMLTARPEDDAALTVVRLLS